MEGRHIVLMVTSTVTDQDQLAALRSFEVNLDALEELVLKCWNEKKVTDEDETEYERLIRNLQPLYGGLSGVLGTPVYQVYGRSFEVYQHILSIPSLSRILGDQTFAGLWQEILSGAQSLVRQAIGRLEAQDRQGRLALSPETVSHWKWLIVPLEKARRAALDLWTWAIPRPSFLDRLLRRLEGSPLYRTLAVVATVGTAIGIIVLVVSLR